MKTLVVLGVIILVGAVTAVVVQQGGGWSTLTGKAWAITYEVSAQPTGPATQVRYVENPDRYKKQTPQAVTETVSPPWRTEVVINAGEQAQVSATAGDQALTCRILLDGEKVLASATAAPGRKLLCEAVTGS
jgi:hypothetical protein